MNPQQPESPNIKDSLPPLHQREDPSKPPPILRCSTGTTTRPNYTETTSKAPRKGPPGRCPGWHDDKHGYTGSGLAGYFAATETEGDRLTPYPTGVACCVAITRAMIASTSPGEENFRYVMALLTDTQEGNVLDGIAPHIRSFPAAFKAAHKHKGSDPDTPTFYEAMSGPHEVEFRLAMEQELEQLTSLNCWEVMWRN